MTNPLMREKIYQFAIAVGRWKDAVDLVYTKVDSKEKHVTDRYQVKEQLRTRLQTGGMIAVRLASVESLNATNMHDSCTLQEGWG